MQHKTKTLLRGPQPTAGTIRLRCRCYGIQYCMIAYYGIDYNPDCRSIINQEYLTMKFKCIQDLNILVYKVLCKTKCLTFCYNIMKKKILFSFFLK